MHNLDNFLWHLEDSILTLSIHRPEALNALNQHTFTELNITMQEIDQNDKISGIILTGSGHKAFAAGADIKEFEGLDYKKALKLAQFGQSVFQKIENSNKPFIAAINGFALGGGCELGMACHLRIATKNSKLGQPETNLGIIPGYGGTQRLARLVGMGKAMEWILTGDLISAEDAYHWGLINHLVETEEELMIKSKNIMKTILKRGPLALGAAIKSIQSGYSTNGYQTEAEQFAFCATTEDFNEGTKAFIEKRPPQFKGK